MANYNTMTALKAIGLVVAGIIVGLLFTVVKGDNLAGRYNQVSQYFKSGLYAGETNQFRVEADGDVVSTADATFDDATFSGGQVVVTPADTASSSVYATCYQLTASSTASPVKIVPGKYNSTATTTLYGETSFATAYLVFGTCP